jgi:hypothetical protein
MDDLADLKDAWGQPNPPSPTAYANARAALLQQIAVAGAREPAPMPRRRRGVQLSWLVGGAAVTAAAATAIVFAVVTATPPRSSIPPSSAAGQQHSQLSGRQILLAAATVAETRPTGAGTYWHVTTSSVQSPPTAGLPTPYVTSTWTAHDGTSYIMYQGYTGVRQLPNEHGFGVGGSILTYQQLQQLPTDPSALKAQITDSFIHPSGSHAHTSLGIPAADMPGAVAGALSGLLYEVPAPAAVRAAAFRALASMPDVTNLGTRDGGQALRISYPPPADNLPSGKVSPGADGLTLVIDPATSRLLGQTYRYGTDQILTAEWTNELPGLVQPSHR